MTVPHLLGGRVTNVGGIESAVTTQGCIAGSTDAKLTPRHDGWKVVVGGSFGAANVVLFTQNGPAAVG